MDNEFLIKSLEAAIATRKLQKLIYKQDKPFSARPQAHVFMVDHPGQGKSTISGQLEQSLNGSDGFRWIETITEAGLKGTISSKGRYTPGEIATLGGKLLFVDEFNSIRYSEFPGFLSLLENQKFSKRIAYGVKSNVPEINTPFLKLHVAEGKIEGSCIFSCVACAMEFPDAHTFGRVVPGRSVQDAIYQRFIVVTLDSDAYDALDLIGGKGKIALLDASGSIEKIAISKKTYFEFYEEYRREVEDNFNVDFTELINRRKSGFFSRAFNDLIRMSLPLEMFKHKKEKNVTLNNSRAFIDNIKWLKPMWLNYSMRGEKSNYFAFIEAWANRSDSQTLIDVSQEVGCSYRQAKRYKKRYEKDHPIDLGVVKNG